MLGALCGIIGSMQALEAIKVIVGTGESLAASLLVIDTLSMRTRKLKIKKDPQCPLCSAAASINSIQADRYQDQCETNTTETMPSTYPIEVDIQEAKTLLDNPNTTLIDVREVFELGICQIENSRHIPMNTIPQHLDELPEEGPLLIQCHHGGRSLQVVQYLRQNGFDNAINMGGGIDAWAINHDSTMQRY